MRPGPVYGADLPDGSRLSHPYFESPHTVIIDPGCPRGENTRTGLAVTVEQAPKPLSTTNYAARPPYVKGRDSSSTVLRSASAPAGVCHLDIEFSRITGRSTFTGPI